MDDPNQLGVGMQNRKISVSFVSEVGPTLCTSIDPTQGFNYTPDPSLKYLQQKILRLQVVQVVLGLTLMILSAVAIIECRGIMGLGFGLISALLGIISAAFGIQQFDLKISSILNIFALLGLLPTFYFAIESLVDYSRFYLSQGGEVIIEGPHNQSHHNSTFHTSNNFHQHSVLHRHHQHHLMNGEHDPSSITTIWVLSWLELFHLIPLCVSILYLLFLYRHLSYYTHY